MNHNGENSLNNYIARHGFSYFAGRLLSGSLRLRRARKKRDVAEVTQTKNARTFCAANTTEFGCTVNNSHDFTTLNPIGGGVGYTDVVTSAGAAFVVTTLDELNTALGSVDTNETIFMPGTAEIDLTGQQITLPDVYFTLASDRGYGTSKGALLTSDSTYVNDVDYVFNTNSSGAGGRLSGFRFRGANGEYNVDPDVFGVSSFFKPEDGGWEIDNCHWWNGNKWLIDFKDNISHWVHHNIMHHTQLASFGYPIWVRGRAGGVEPDDEDVSIFECNVFSESRHAIGAAGSDGCSYKARYNFIIDHSAPNHQFDRHGDGGKVTHLIDNVTYSAFDEFFGGMEAKPDPSDIQIIDNHTEHQDLDQAIVAQEQGFADVLSGNTFGGSWRDGEQPTATISASVTEGTVPLTVKFTATGTDPTGNFPINAYLWEYNDSRTYEETNTTNTFTKIFDSAGIYTVGVRSRNSIGIYSSLRTVTIWVKEAESVPALKDHLSEWWEFREAQGEDRVGSHRSVIWEDTTPLTTTGVLGNAARFDGSNTSNIVPRETDIVAMEKFSIYESDYSIAFRVKITSVTSNFEGFLKIGEMRITIDTNNRFQNQAQTRDNGQPGWGLFQTLSNAFTVGEWVDVVLVIPRFGKRKWYIDGVLNSTDSTDLTQKEHYEKMQKGSDTVTLSQSVVGRAAYDLDFIAFWKRQLTAAEALAIHNSGSGLAYADIT